MSGERITRQEYRAMADQPLDELAKSCTFETFHAHGPGGQGVNTADSAVRARHRPTGIVVTSRESRSQYRNRQLCLQKIRAELKRRGIPRRHRVATKPTYASVVRRLNDKRARSQVKKLRRRVGDDE